jgi:minor extracellular protease Epr
MIVYSLPTEVLSYDYEEQSESEWYQSYIVSLLQLREVHENGITGKGTRLAMIETGCYNSHKALNHVILKNIVDESTLRRIHGTKTAGIAAGKSYKSGDKEYPGGVAPDAEVTMFCVDLKWHSFLEALKRISEARDPYDVLSISLGVHEVSDGTKDEVRDLVKAIRERGTVIFAASGNIGRRGNIAFPASLHDVISVAALSQYAKPLDSARDKGVDVYCYGKVTAPKSDSDGLEVASGSSMATPAVAGIACLAFQCAKKYDMDSSNKVLEKLRRIPEMKQMLNTEMQARGKENVMEPADFLINADVSPSPFDKL